MNYKELKDKYPEFIYQNYAKDNNKSKFEKKINYSYKELRDMYPNFIYNSYEIKEEDNNLALVFHFEIKGLTTFSPKTIISKDIIKNSNIDDKLLNYLVFHIGLIEMISYYKATISKNIIIKCGYLDNKQIKFFTKLIYNGLGEFLYVNKIDIKEKDLTKIIIDYKKDKISKINYEGMGSLIPIGGGKDSIVTLESLKDFDVTPVVQNPKDVQLECIKVSGINNYISFKREIDKNLLMLNDRGFLNGHTPFSSLLAFELYLIAYLNNKKYIVLSNEASANESTVLGKKINHQYSKTYEFENDFNNYTKSYFNIGITYFSFLRPLSEYQIALLFSKYEKYHNIFRSCNVGSKSKTWEWCCNCPKCLFVYIMLSPFIEEKKLIKMFGTNLLDKKDLITTFRELLGETGVKPFECIGEVKEIEYALSKTIFKYKDNDKLPCLLGYFKDNYDINTSLDLEHKFNKKNNLNKEFLDILKKEYDKYV